MAGVIRLGEGAELLSVCAGGRVTENNNRREKSMVILKLFFPTFLNIFISGYSIINSEVFHYFMVVVYINTCFCQFQEDFSFG